jgi:non-heme chloroperoxidase
MPFVTTDDGTEIFYKDWGSGQPVVFHHGWPLSSDDWDAQMTFFVLRGYRVVAHDRRGHGRSTQTSDGHDMDTYAADAAAVVRHLDLRDAVHIGHSTGGGEVTRYVARHGEGRVAKAILVGAVPPLMAQSDANPDGVPMETLDGFREGTGFNRAQFFRDVAAGPFYGYNRPGATPSDGVIDNWWRQGMMGALRGDQGVLRDRLHRGPPCDRGPDPRDARRRRPGRADRHLGETDDRAAAARRAEGVSRLSARDADHARGRAQPRPPGLRRGLTTTRRRRAGTSPATHNLAPRNERELHTVGPWR